MTTNNRVTQYLLQAAPIGEIGHFGDFANPSPPDSGFDDVNRQLVSHPKVLRSLKTLVRSPYNINIYFWNTHANHIFETATGNPFSDQVGYDMLLRVTSVKKFNEWAAMHEPPVVIKPRPRSINVVMMGNDDGEHPLSPWMIIHRAAHFVEGGTSRGAEATAAFRKYCIAKNEFLKRLGTSRSFRTRFFDKLSLAEVPIELMTQYLVQGRIKLVKNHPWIKTEVRDSLEITLNDMAEAAVQSILGKVIVTR